jgi:hypothetical protein
MITRTKNQNIIKRTDFVGVAKSVKLDAKKRVCLPKAVVVREDVTYHIYTNSLGQIVLDPQVTVPVSEAWLFENPEALALVRQGLADAAQGKVSKIDPAAL